MLKLSVNDLITDDETCYSFVVGIAKRARKISETANDEGVLLDEKPVQIAVREFTEGKYHILPPKNKPGEDGAEEKHSDGFEPDVPEN